MIEREKRVEEKIEGKYEGKLAALSLRQCEFFSFNPLHINAACIELSSMPFPCNISCFDFIQSIMVLQCYVST